MKFPAISALLWGTALAALDVNINDANSIKDAAKSVAKNLMSYYNGNQPGKTPGILPGPPPAGDYYWWEAGAMWNTLIDYWRSTGDATYNDLVVQGILWQVGPLNNFMPLNVTVSLGTDDQGFWAMAAATAAETGFTNPSTTPDTQWLALAQAVFESQASRWDSAPDQCGGGLRWQIPPSNMGYDYKNSMSTGVLFNVAARLGRLTGNATYAEWADRAWSWMESVGFLDADSGAIYDGAHVETNCTDINEERFSYVLGVFIHGAAHMYNYSSSSSSSAGGAGAAVWRARLSTLVNATSAFTDDRCVPFEPACEARGSCTTDMLAFKSILLRGLAAAARLAPYAAPQLACVLEGAATAAASSCDDAGGDGGARCGFVWTAGTDDGLYGAGQQMNALVALGVRYELLAGPGGNGTLGVGGSGGNGTGTGTGSGNATQSGGATAATSTGGKSGAGMAVDRAGTGVLGLGAVVAAVFTVLLA